MKKIISNIVIFILFIIAAVGSTAIESRYKNNLLNVELSQTPDNRVSVLLVFEKPYNEPVKVIYKTDNEYNILLPETYHSITSVNTLNALNIRSANVKLVPYFNQDNANGYTKISIKTTRPVVFNAHASYITTQIADNELIDKLERDDDIKFADEVAQLPVVKPQVTTKTKVAKAKQTPKPTTIAKKSATTVKKAAKTVPAKPKAPVKTATTPIAKQPAKTAPPAPVITPTTEQAAETRSITDEKLALMPDINAIADNTDNKISPSQQTITEEKEVTQSQNTLPNTENIHIAFLSGAALLLFILLLRVLGKQNKIISTPSNIQHQENTAESPESNIPQEIQNLSWQDKYKYMKQKENPQFDLKQTDIQNSAYADSIENNAHSFTDELKEIADSFEENIQNENLFVPSESIPTVNESNNSFPSDELVEEAFLENFIDEEEPETTEQNETLDPFGLNKEPINEGFEPAQIHLHKPEKNKTGIENTARFNEKPIRNSSETKENNATENKKQYISNPVEPTLINQAKISKTKGFYLVRYGSEVALMGYIKDQVFLINSFQNTNQSFVQTRLTEKKRGSDIYMVRSDDYKALVEVSKDTMKTLIKL